MPRQEVWFPDKSGVMFAVKQSRKIEFDGRKLRVFKSKDEKTLLLQKQAKFTGLRTERVARKKFTKKCSQSDRKSGQRKMLSERGLRVKYPQRPQSQFM